MVPKLKTLKNKTTWSEPQVHSSLWEKKHYTDIKIPIFVAQPLKYYTFIFQMLIYFDSSRKSSFYKAVLNESGPVSW